MKKIFLFVAALAFFVSCEEFQPVFTGKYDNPAPYEVYSDDDFDNIKSIQYLKDQYKKSGEGNEITESFQVKGQVISSDRSGNVYKSFYIQDETGGIEIKIGKNGLYNDYKLGQWVYVDCEGLYVGMYNNMPQLGFKDPTKEYETSYIEDNSLINAHVFRGEIDEPIPANELASLPAVTSDEGKKLLGTYVELKGLKCKNKSFTLVYINPNLRGDKKKDNSNRMFLDEKGTWGVDTWAMSKEKCIEYLCSDLWQSAKTNTGITLPQVWNRETKSGILIPTANSVSQYFDFNGTDVQVRTSGYCKFSDTKIPPEVLNGSKTINLKGILTVYKDDYQFTIIDLDTDMTIN